MRRDGLAVDADEADPVVADDDLDGRLPLVLPDGAVPQAPLAHDMVARRDSDLHHTRTLDTAADVAAEAKVLFLLWGSREGGDAGARCGYLRRPGGARSHDHVRCEFW
jgi:hypothetical protein